MNKKIKIITVLLISVFLIMIFSTNSFAIKDFAGGLTWSSSDVGDLNKLGTKLLTITRNLAIIIAVIVLSIIGIKYMVGSVEERAGYKKALIPFVVGAIIVAGASEITTTIFTIAAESDTSQITAQVDAVDDENYSSGELKGVQEISRKILTAVRNIAIIVAVMIISILGIKYMLGSAEEKAGYKKSFMPLIIGALLVSGAAEVVKVLFSLNA